MTNGYVASELARAFVTALTHEDADTRTRAQQRVAAWASTLEGMASGRVSVGSRTPVKDLPAWVTLEVLRGGFATGAPIAGGPMEPDELEQTATLGPGAGRASIYAQHLSVDGLAALQRMVHERTYEVRVPEDSALLTIAWLIGAGDLDGAAEVLSHIEWFAGRLRFSPRVDPAPSADPEQVWRLSAGQARQVLAARTPNPQVQTMKDVLAQWLPLRDELRALWESSRDGAGTPGGAWSQEHTATLARIVADRDALAATAVPPRRFRRKGENFTVMLEAAQVRAAGQLSAHQLSVITLVLDRLEAAEGPLSDPALQRLRQEQARTAAQPGHHEFAHLAAARLAPYPAVRGLQRPEELATPVSPQESRPGMTAGTPLPASVVRTLARTRAGTLEELIEQGVVSSAEVLADLTPAVTAREVAAAYDDADLGELMAATYTAFRNRRTLLLLDLAKQVQFAELPWVAAAQRHRRAGISSTAGQVHDPAAVARRLAALTLQAFPATIVPNPMVAELSTIFAAAGQDVVLTEELAADIFMGRFSPKFLRAANVAGQQLRGSVYARYYGIDYDEVAALGDDRERSRSWWGLRPRPASAPQVTFAEYCERDVPDLGVWSPARNGMVIERAQQVTTHNLAQLVAAGVRPRAGWDELASAAAAAAVELLVSAGARGSLTGVKSAGYAWRQALFFATTSGPHGPQALMGALVAHANAHEGHDAVAALVAGYGHVLDGGQFDADGVAGEGRRLSGWSQQGHWALPDGVRTA